MSFIQNIIEPKRVWLVWQSNLSGQARSRRFVGEISNAPANNGVTFRYLEGTTDFSIAKSEGFDGFPAFKLDTVEHTQGVLEAFMRRLPPRNREDFNEYLARHRLPSDSKFSDLALLGYTGAKLPSDSFEFYADLIDATPPFELVVEVAGFRHQSKVASGDLTIGEFVTFMPEPDNAFDSKAIAIIYKNQRIGHIGRTQTAIFHHWMSKNYTIEAMIERINGKPDRPLIYLFITVR